jgi:hypothetical protein
MNIFLAVTIAAIGAFIAALGGHLASTKKWHKWAFWGGGIVMLVLIFVQTVINERSQDRLQSQLDKIQHNTEQPPQVNVSNTIDTSPIAKTLQLGNKPSVTAAPFKEPKDSLRKRTVRLVDEIEAWAKARSADYPQPLGQDDATLEKRRREFNIKLEQEYDEKYKQRLLVVVKQLDIAGCDTGYLLGQYGLKVRTPTGDELEQIRNMAYRLNAHDKLVQF